MFNNQDDRKLLEALIVAASVGAFVTLFALGVVAIDLTASMADHYRAEARQTHIITQQMRRNLNTGTVKACSQRGEPREYPA